MTDPSVELALAELTRKIEVGFTKTDGQLALLLQRTEAMERRADVQDAAIAKLDERVDGVERTTITRDELEARDERMRSELAEEARRRLMLWALVVTIVMGLLGAGVGALGLLVR